MGVADMKSEIPAPAVSPHPVKAGSQLTIFLKQPQEREGNEVAEHGQLVPSFRSVRPPELNSSQPDRQSLARKTTKKRELTRTCTVHAHTASSEIETRARSAPLSGSPLPRSAVDVLPLPPAQTAPPCGRVYSRDSSETVGSSGEGGSARHREGRRGGEGNEGRGGGRLRSWVGANRNVVKEGAQTRSDTSPSPSPARRMLTAYMAI